jgi:hypothetical protein
MNKMPLNFYINSLKMKAVHIQCLDENKNKINGAYASGFIVQEKDNFFLYTCWHVVTGLNMHDVEIKNLPNRKFLEVNLQNCETRQPGLQAIGGNQSTIIPIYDEKNKPLWIQNQQDTPNDSLNSIQLKVPLLHDCVKLKLPKNIQLSIMQYVTEEQTYRYLTNVSDKILIVGFPYGYSVLGLESPTAIILTRFIASDKIKDRHTEILLDGPGAPGMSGAPVFIEKDNSLFLIGIYTGLIYPDYSINQNEKTTALGTICLLNLWWHVKNE